MFEKLKPISLYGFLKVGGLLALLMVFFSVGGLSYVYQDMLKSILGATIQTTFRSVALYAEGESVFEQPARLKVMLQNVVFTLPILSKAAILDEHKNVLIEVNKRVSQEEVSARESIDDLKPSIRTYDFDWNDVGVMRAISVFDRRHQQFQTLYLAFWFDQGYIQHFKDLVWRLMLLALGVLVGWILLTLWLFRRMLLDELQVIGSKRIQDAQALNRKWTFKEVASLAQRLFSAEREQQKILQALEEQAITDPLTGCLNRRGVLQALKAWYAKVHRGEVCVVIFLDIDGFRHINEQYGHHQGDALLKVVAERLRQALPDSEAIGRMSGDEFFLLIPFEQDALLTLDEKLVAFSARISQPYMLPPNRKINLTASMGVAIAPQDADTPEEMLKVVDIALQEAKRINRGSYCLFNRALYEQHIRLQKIAQQIPEALEKGCFKLVYQPKVDITAGRVVGFEALARLHLPELGFISPVEFIPIVNQSVHSEAFARWVMETGIAFISQFKGKDAPGISLNLQKKQLRHDFIGQLLETADKYGVAPQRLTLELLESDFFEAGQPDENELFSRLNQFGIKLAIDDFGTGYSSLAYLQKLAVDELKVDRSFVVSLDEDAKAALPVMTAIYEMADALSLMAIVEGVETRAQLEVLRKIGYRYVQGYYFSKPLPEDEAAALDLEFPKQFL